MDAIEPWAVAVVMETSARLSLRARLRMPLPGERVEEIGFVWALSYRRGQPVTINVPAGFHKAIERGVLDWSIVRVVEDETNSDATRESGVCRVRLRMRLTVPVKRKRGRASL